MTSPVTPSSSHSSWSNVASRRSPSPFQSPDLEPAFTDDFPGSGNRIQTQREEDLTGITHLCDVDKTSQWSSASDVQQNADKGTSSGQQSTSQSQVQQEQHCPSDPEISGHHICLSTQICDVPVDLSYNIDQYLSRELHQSRSSQEAHHGVALHFPQSAKDPAPVGGHVRGTKDEEMHRVIGSLHDE